MSDDIYHFVTHYFGVSGFNTVLLGIIFFLVRQRYNALIEDLTNYEKRIDSLEKTFLVHGFKIYNPEDV